MTKATSRLGSPTFTEQHALQSAQANTRARRFIAKAAHELMTPLSIAQGELELSLRQPRDPARDQATIEVAFGQVRQVVGLVADVLSLASIASRDPADMSRGLQLDALVHDAVTASLMASPVHRTADVKADRAEIEGHEDDLWRLVKALVDNALEHGPADGRVVVRARLRRTSPVAAVVISVEDDGPGIPVELHERIFEPFWRGAGPRDGAGLGLTMVREVARAHAGEALVDASSKRTRLVVTIRAARAEESASSSERRRKG